MGGTVARDLQERHSPAVPLTVSPLCARSLLMAIAWIAARCKGGCDSSRGRCAALTLSLVLIATRPLEALAATSIPEIEPLERIRDHLALYEHAPSTYQLVIERTTIRRRSALEVERLLEGLRRGRSHLDDHDRLRARLLALNDEPQISHVSVFAGEGRYRAEVTQSPPLNFTDVDSVPEPRHDVVVQGTQGNWSIDQPGRSAWLRHGQYSPGDVCQAFGSDGEWGGGEMFISGGRPVEHIREIRGLRTIVTAQGTRWVEIEMRPGSPAQRWIGYDPEQESAASPLSHLVTSAPDRGGLEVVQFQDWRDFGPIRRPARITVARWPEDSGTDIPGVLRVMDSPAPSERTLAILHLAVGIPASEELFRFTPPAGFRVAEELPDGRRRIWGESEIAQAPAAPREVPPPAPGAGRPASPATATASPFDPTLMTLAIGLGLFLLGIAAWLFGRRRWQP